MQMSHGKRIFENLIVIFRVHAKCVPSIRWNNAMNNTDLRCVGGGCSGLICICLKLSVYRKGDSQPKLSSSSVHPARNG